MKQSSALEFESCAFAVIPGEDAETNPGIYGKALAQWLCAQLRASGLPAEDAFAEDFGWLVPIQSRPHRLYVACANSDETGNQWRVFAFAEGGVLARIMGKDKSAESVALLFTALRRILESAPSVRHLRDEQ
jgi:hypothetical protein